jgi:hypothetical protein
MKLLPCPFCGSTNIDAEGWASSERAGPACDDCSGTADTVTLWNRRPAANRIEALEAALRDIAGQMLIDEHGEDYNGDYEAGYEAIVRIARAALAPEQNK